MKMRLLLILGAWLMGTVAHAQKLSGVVNYNYEYDYVKLVEQNQFLTQGEKEKAIQLNRRYSTYTEKMVLLFNEEHSYFGKATDGPDNSWSNVELWVRRNLKDQKVKELRMLAGKVYHLEDDFYTFPWKIKTEIKEILGYECMLATYYDSVRQTEFKAWFTTAIPLNLGPDQFMGLPGLILEVSMYDEAITYRATSVSLKETKAIPPLPKKIKGKLVNKATYDQQVKTIVEENNKRKRLSIYDLDF